MIRFWIQPIVYLCMIFTGVLYSQAPVSPVSPIPKTSTIDEPVEVHKDASALDKEYYEYYFRTIPDVDSLEKAKLEYNLIRSFKLELRKREPETSQSYLKGIKSSSVRYERVKSDSIWMRGIRSQMQHIRFQEYMYIIIYDKYFCYISYEINPSRYVMEPFQVQLIFKKENPFFIKLPDP
ncbi:hypothetical protein AB3N59_19940 [Leptospira sp. WS92.C1]